VFSSFGVVGAYLSAGPQQDAIAELPRVPAHYWSALG
jgi:hypothetical protein